LTVAVTGQNTDFGLSAFLAGLAAQGGGERRLPPVEAWNPDRCTEEGDFRIRADGVWFHEGSPIGREAMVRLFSSILRKDADGGTYLVTPGEKVRVKVEDAPFLAVRVDRHGEGAGQTLVFTTQVGDVVAMGPEHPLRVTFDRATGEPRPYVMVRGRLEARILRAPFYEMTAWADHHEGRFGVWSGGAFFALEPG
jgi:hypothetical protein